MHDKDRIDALEPICLFEDLEDFGTAFCKFSKSVEGVKVLCVENHYIDYTKGGVISDTNPDGHGYLSFCEIRHAILMMSYGDVFTELETNRNIVQIRMPDVPVRALGGAFGEYVAPTVLVRQNVSLADLSLHQRLITHADQRLLRAVVKPPLPSLSISRHLHKFGFTDAEKYWQEIEAYAQRQMQRLGTKSMTEIMSEIQTKYGEQKSKSQDLSIIR